MQTLTESVFKLHPPYGVFNTTVVTNLFPGLTPGAKKALINRAFKAGEIQKLKPGLYCLAGPYQSNPPHPFVLAGLLHPLSYVSLESALRYHGLIPEAVYQTTCATQERSRVFTTPRGRFSFVRIPGKTPPAGVQFVPLDGQAGVMVASPWRAIADLVYSRREINAKKNGLDFLTGSLRMEPEDLAGLDQRELPGIIRGFRSRRVKTCLKRLQKELAHA